ncbi:MAG: class I SAM-dependent methyltransferase [Chloroflexi bacterium]|nr:class I SAM-dependent methyltransferase [Chloroflexota bacterium]
MTTTAVQEHAPDAAIYNLASSGQGAALSLFAKVAARLVQYAELRDGHIVLDVATGSGAAAIAAGRAVAPSGKVVAIDVAQGMIAQVESNVRAAHRSNVEVKEGRAMQIEFSDNTFDEVICSSAIFVLPDVPGALKEWMRVAKPGGQVAFTTYRESIFQPLSGLFEKRIRNYGVALPTARPFSWQSLSEPQKCRELLRNAGLTGISVMVEQTGYNLRRADDWWELLWNTGFRDYLGALSRRKLEQFRSEHLEDVNALKTASGIWLDVPVIFAFGQKPS